MLEIWKPVVGYEDYYEVSDLGRVRSLDQWLSNRSSQYLKRGRFRKPFLAGRPLRYHYIDLYQEGKHQRSKVSRLVLEAFVGPCPDGTEACHNDGNSLNNRLTNLRWDTRANNMADKVSHGTDNRGSKNYQTKLTDQDVREMRQLVSEGFSQRAIAKHYGISWKNLSAIIGRKSWKHLV